MTDDSDEILDRIVSDAHRRREETNRIVEERALRKRHRKMFENAWQQVADACIPEVPDDRTIDQYWDDAETSFIQLARMLVDCGWAEWLPSMFKSIDEARRNELAGLQNRQEQLFVIRLIQKACDREMPPGSIASQLSKIDDWIEDKTAMCAAVHSLREFFQARQSQLDRERAILSKSSPPQTQDDLLTIDEIAKVVGVRAKTLRNKKVLGEPSISGGGRGRKAKWHYLEKKPDLEREWGESMPSLEEARRILSSG